jgi:metallo-beta-lactamase class B
MNLSDKMRGGFLQRETFMRAVTKSPRFALAIAVLAFATSSAWAQDPPSEEYLAAHPDEFLVGAVKALKWEEPFQPVHVVGPIHYIGTVGLGAYLINTSEGHIVVNTGMPSSGPMMIEGIQSLGFQPADVKIILSVHAHTDHAGAVAYLKEKTGASFAMMEGDVAAMLDGGRSDFHYGSDEAFYFPPATVDRVLRDGDVVRLGEVAITALEMGGHTRGNTTFVLDVIENGKSYAVVITDGAGFNPGYRLAVDESYPGIGDDYRRNLARLELLKPDIWLGSHSERFDLVDRAARARSGEGVTAWLNREQYRQQIVHQRNLFEAEIAKELGATSP